MVKGSLQGKLLFPIIFGGIFIVITILFFLAKTQKEIVVHSGLDMADLVVNQSSEMRKIYAGKIMPKIKENGGYDSVDWETTKGAVPAAATLVNMVGHNLAQTIPGVELRLYSEVPFKNRTLDLDGFEKKPLDIPSDPKRAYENDGWIDYSDWLGTDIDITQKSKEFNPFFTLENLKNEDI